MPAPSLPAPLADAARVAVAPMAGGPGSPELVAAATAGGWFAQLAGGYRSVNGLRDDIARARALGAGAFGVNLFAPTIHPIDQAAYAAYRDRIAPDVAAHAPDAAVPERTEDDDAWAGKVALAIELDVPVVSVTFGLPDAWALDALARAGIAVLQTVTSAREAALATAAGVDALVVQGAAAGGHSGIWHRDALPADVPLAELVATVRAASPLPVVATGGVVAREQVAELLAAGAEAVAVGTALLLADEAGTSATHRAALVDPSIASTIMTRAFTGRPARALENDFAVRHSAHAPSGYPAIHHLTRPMRQAAAAAGDPSAVHLWAGAGWRGIRGGSATEVLDAFAPSD